MRSIPYCALLAIAVSATACGSSILSGIPDSDTTEDAPLADIAEVIDTHYDHSDTHLDYDIESISDSVMDEDSGSDPGLEDYAELAPDPTSDPTEEPIADVVFDPISDFMPDRPGDSVSDPDPPRDITWDPYTDVPPDGMVGRCNVIEQTGCPPGAWCSWAVDVTYCHWYEECTFRTAGTLGPGDLCAGVSTDWCEPGTECQTDRSHVYVCQEWCRDDLDCSLSGTSCTAPLSGIWTLGPCTGASFVFPYGLCE